MIGTVEATPEPGTSRKLQAVGTFSAAVPTISSCRFSQIVVTKQLAVIQASNYSLVVGGVTPDLQDSPKGARRGVTLLACAKLPPSVGSPLTESRGSRSDDGQVEQLKNVVQSLSHASEDDPGPEVKGVSRRDGSRAAARLVGWSFDEEALILPPDRSRGSEPAHPEGNMIMMCLFVRGLPGRSARPLPSPALLRAWMKRCSPLR